MLVYLVGANNPTGSAVRQLSGRSDNREVLDLRDVGIRDRGRVGIGDAGPTGIRKVDLVGADGQRGG